MTLEPVGFIALPGGPGATFDHADTLGDPVVGSRLYVAHTAMNAVDVIGCQRNEYLRTIADLPGVAGVLIDTEQDLLFTSDRAAARVSIFQCSDETLLGRVAVGHRPNGLALDSVRRRLYSFNLGDPAGTGCTASVISIDDLRVVSTIPLPGRPRWAVYDTANDRVYANIQEPAVILIIDPEQMREIGRIEVGAAGPHGLGLVDGRLFCAADGGELVVVEGLAGTPRVTKRLPLRGTPDVVMIDPRLRRLWVAIGSPGVVTAFDTDHLAEVETIATGEGAHTFGWDPATSQLYAFAPQRGGALVYRETS